MAFVIILFPHPNMRSLFYQMRETEAEVHRASASVWDYIVGNQDLADNQKQK